MAIPGIKQSAKRKSEDELIQMAKRPLCESVAERQVASERLSHHGLPAAIPPCYIAEDADVAMLDVRAFQSLPVDVQEGSLDLSLRVDWGAAMHMPACSIKSAIVLREWAWVLQQHSSAIHFQTDDGRVFLGRVSKNSAIQLCNQFETQLQMEKLSTHDSSAQVMMLKSALAKDNFTLAHDRAATLLESARPFNMRLCASLVENSLQQTLALKGQEAAVLIGYTGAGKSSLVHFLKGTPFVRGDSGRPVPDPHSGGLHGVRVSAGTASETTYVVAVPLLYSEVPDPESILPSVQRALASSTDCIVLCDTPGRSDTRGCELSVANELGIVNAVKDAGSVRIVLVFSKMGVGSRLELVPKLLKTVATCAETIADHIQCVRFIWTGFSKEELQKLVPDMIRQLVEHPNAEYQHDEAVCALLEEAHSQIISRLKTTDSLGGAMGLDLSQYVVEAEAKDTDKVMLEKE